MVAPLAALAANLHALRSRDNPGSATPPADRVEGSTLIRAAIERTNLSEFADIENAVLSGDQLLWLAISDHVEAAATTHQKTVDLCHGPQQARQPAAT